MKQKNKKENFKYVIRYFTYQFIKKFVSGKGIARAGSGHLSKKGKGIARAGYGRPSQNKMDF